MGLFGQLFSKDKNDRGTMVGHALSLAGGFMLLTPEGNALLTRLVQPEMATIIAAFLTYVGTAKAAQDPTP